MLARLNAHRNRRLLARLGVLSFVFVLLCVPALTRIGQKLQPVPPVSQAPSFAKNIDCPPKKVVVSPTTAVVAVVLVLEGDDAPPPPVVSSLNRPFPETPSLSAPVPLRAPPLVHFV
ncbi:MAG TPA: hypothetical protein VGG73_10835 [Vicinamibacterales bacterium]